jgi:riboflavin synthase
MFTGLVEGTGKIVEMHVDSSGGGILSIGNLPWQETLAIGDSVAVNGACLTVADTGAGGFKAELSPETLSRTNLSSLEAGDLVNLERPLRLGDRLGGHLVLGHVDGLGTLTRIDPQGEFWTVDVEMPPSLARYAVEKGSIAVDGISLTIASLSGNLFTVAIIPKTWECTNLASRKTGDRVNLESDIIAKHIERLIHPKAIESPITESFLAEHGFL